MIETVDRIIFSIQVPDLIPPDSQPEREDASDNDSACDCCYRPRRRTHGVQQHRGRTHSDGIEMTSIDAKDPEEPRKRRPAGESGLESSTV